MMMMMRPSISLFRIDVDKKISCMFCKSITDFFYLTPIINVNSPEKWRGFPVCENCHEKIQKNTEHSEVLY